MSELTRQQLCSALKVCEHTIRRLELQGMPVEATIGSRNKRYNLVRCKTWLRANTPGLLKNLPPEPPRNFYSSNARAKTLKRMPAWADKRAIRDVYLEAQRITHQSGILHHVDHVYPLQGELVSGLHVHNNLQVLTATANGQKHNRYDV